jgi:hypothetical protein
MLKRLFLFSLVALLLSTAPVAAKTIEGVDLPDTLSEGQSQLILNGAGVRNKWFLDLYVAGLYLKTAQNQPGPIITADQPMAIRLVITSSMITSSKMEKAVREGFANATAGHLSHLQGRIDRFIDVFHTPVNPGDIYLMIYQPGSGVEIRKNGETSSMVEGLDFKQALFGIWLAETPAQESLKQELLGN